MIVYLSAYEKSKPGEKKFINSKLQKQFITQAKKIRIENDYHEFMLYYSSNL